MSNKLSYLFSLALILAFAGFASAELLINPGFEDGEDSWATWGGGSGSAGGYFYDSSYHADVMEDGTAHSGDRYMESLLQDRAGWWWSGMWVMQNHPVTAGKTYQLSGWVRDGAADGDSSLIEDDLRLTWEWRIQAPDGPTGPRYDEIDPDEDGDTGEHRNNTPFDLTGEWTYVSDIQVAPETAEGVTVGFLVSAGVTLDVDDASFIELGLKSLAPAPANNEDDVCQRPILSWTPGSYADMSDVYFGTDLNEVRDANTTVDPTGVYKGRQSASEYAIAETLDFGATYYWRVDGIQSVPEFEIGLGDVWQFTVEPFAYPIDAVTATASVSNDPDAFVENIVNGSGLDANDMHSMNQAEMWLTEMTDALPTIQFEFDDVYRLHEMWVWNFNISVEMAVGMGVKDVKISTSLEGDTWTELPDAQFAQGASDAAYAANTIIDFNDAYAQYVKIEVLNNWGGLVKKYGLSEVRFLHRPFKARQPEPADMSTDVSIEALLSWRPGRSVASHQVYFSTDEQAVLDGSAPMSELPASELCQPSSVPDTLNFGQTYFWRVDEVNEAEAIGALPGAVWSFTAADHRVVDDMESYGNSIDLGQPGSRIWYAWTDGMGWTEPAPGNPGNGTGAAVGNWPAPIAETSIVHGGNQSMPFYYDNTGSLNNARVSEATISTSGLPIGTDWAKGGATSLSIWFYGAANNIVTANDQMYVKLNNVKIPFTGSADALADETWHEWPIDLSGVDLTNISTMTIGFGTGTNTGGTGVVYFDDIALR